MAGKTSVVTPERFATGLSYEKYIAQINVNKDRFQDFYGSGQLSAEDAGFRCHRMMPTSSRRQ